MKFIIEFALRPGNKNKAVQAFEQRGPSRNPGVAFHSAWVGKNDDVIFVLAESTDESFVTSAAKTWSESGNFRVIPVIDLEQF